MSAASISSSHAPVGAVVVTYFPDAEFDARLAAIARQTSPVIVVDNSADAAVRHRLEKLSAALGATFLANPDNLGLGAALNRAFRELAATEWIVAFDQDSTPAPGCIAALFDRATSWPPVPAVVGANWTDAARPGFPARHLRPHPWCSGWFRREIAQDDIHSVTCVITSGSLFHRPTWNELGGFDESLFLDLVDTDYCLRAGRSGRLIAVAAGARLDHHRGAKRAVAFAGRTFWPAFAPPVRLRYLFRNRLLLFRRHALEFPHWVAFELVYAAKIAAEILFLEDNKTAKLAACLRGTWDGLWGRSGPLRSS
jgi:rhamnosyltransferase